MKMRQLAQQIAMACCTATFTAGTYAATVGVQIPPPGPGDIPDYFGVTPNYATSPQPILTEVAITDAGKGGGATATATMNATGGLVSVTAGATGAGYVNPEVIITDEATGGSADAVPGPDFVALGGITQLGDIPANSGFAASSTFDVNLVGDGTGATGSATTDANGGVVSVTITNPGAGYSAGSTITLKDPTNPTADGPAVTVSTVGTGALTSIAVVNGGSSYSAQSTVKIIDLGGNGSGAAASVIVDASGTITGFTVTNPGSGYVSPEIVVSDVATGTGAVVTANVSSTKGTANGQITSYTVVNAGSGYRKPTLSIVDAGVTGGTGAVVAATTYDYVNGAQTPQIQDIQVVNGGSGYTAATEVLIKGFGPNVQPAKAIPTIEGGVITGFTLVDPGAGYDTPKTGTGIRKFVDSLSTLDLSGTAPGNNLGQKLPIAAPTTIPAVKDAQGNVLVPEADYYEIAEIEYTQKLHSDLPATHLRGYIQIDPATGSYIGKPQYLGPIIAAQKDRPVRVKLVNKLSTGQAGNLPFPVDHTYAGADNKTDTDNRTSMHLHGGNTPWISDGTPRQWVKPAGEKGPNRGESARDVPDMWFDASGKALLNCMGQPTCAVSGATNSPGAGALTFYFTNQQSARFMFYHDHAEGITRLNVYAGMAAGYILNDPTEQAMVNSGVLPGIQDTIPLIIQEKTFVPDDSTPILNFYGAFKSQLNSQDPTWRWGSGVGAAGQNGSGDVWVPHVFMPNQNPGDPSGANAVGRWDYGPWFWPPFAGIQNGEQPNPYFDPACDTSTGQNVNPTLGTCEGASIPGTPNGAINVYGASNPLSEPSGTPEAFNDTPLVNGTVYPHIEVQPKKYRLRILTAGDDRHLNLSMVVAASNKSDTTETGNTGSQSSAVLCKGTGPSDFGKQPGVAPECTEVKMVPWDKAQDKVTHFPAWWYSPLNTGVTFDGRTGGVFDPASRGPAMVQIGTEGGFLGTPAVIRNQPINYEYNAKNIVVGSVKEHALLLGPAERADVVVDFSKFAGSTIVLYNDAPAALPAGDLRLDYFTGDPDNTDSGGTLSTLPGYGPNSRTLMQFRVAPCGNGATGCDSSAPPDYVDPTYVTTDASGKATGGTLVTAVQNAFKTSQEPIVVPQAAYNPVYGTAVSDSLGGSMSSISGTQLSYKPLAVDGNGMATGQLDSTAVTLNFQPKSIIEDWTRDYGRMNAMLGVEMPHTTAINQTSIPQGFIDPATELVKISHASTPITGVMPDGTQIWKITHNGVDTHPVHFHLFSVQLLNRVGWDGAVVAPDANELGWKETVRMNQLQDVIVALRPKTMSLPFKIGNSHRTQDPANASSAVNTNMSFNLDPTTGNGSNVTNVASNFGWEYMWHCHILGHEENDFMRPLAVAAEPETPTGFKAASVTNGVKLDWIDNSMVSNWVSILRATDAAFSQNLTSFNVVQAECASQTGCARTYTDKTAAKGVSYFYKLTSNNTVGSGNGTVEGGYDTTTGAWKVALPNVVDNSDNAASLTPGFTGYGSVTANSFPVVTSLSLTPIANLTASLAMGNVNVGGTKNLTTVQLTNAGGGNLSISGIATSGAPFTRSGGTCPTTFPASLTAGSSCTIGVTFAPTTQGALTGTLTVTDNSNGVAGSTQTTALSGAGIVPVTASPASLTFASTATGATSATQTVTITNVSGAALTLNSNGVTFPSQFARSTTSAGTCNYTGTAAQRTLANNGSCTLGVVFKPTTMGPKTGNLTVANSTRYTASIALSGTTPVPVASLSSGSLTFPGTNTGATSAAQTLTLSNTGAAALTISSISATAPFARSGGTCATSLAAGSSCTIGVTFTPTVAGAASGTLTVNDNSNGVSGTTQTASLSGTGNLVAPAAPAVPTAASVAATSLTLNWSAVSGATGYTVQQATNSTFTTGLVTTNSATTSLAVTGLSANTTYYFRVSATNSAGTSAYSSNFSVTTAPGMATGVTAVNGLTTDGTTRSGGLSWTAPAGGATRYNVRYSATNTMLLPTTVNNVTSGTRFNITLLIGTSGTRYMQVQAVNANGVAGSWSPATPVAVTVQ